MLPVIFKIGHFEIHSYGLMLALAFLVAVVAISREVKRYDIPLDAIIDLATWVLIGAVAGARIAYVLTDLTEFSGRPWYQVFLVNSGGLAFHGGLIGGFLGGFWYVKRKKMDPWMLADIVTPYIALGYALVRIGCLLNGCCYGKPTTLPWAMHCAKDDSLLRHPTQLYSMLGSLILFLILYRLRKHKQFPGFLFLLYVGLYSIMRFSVEFFRESPMVLPWLSLAQLVCVVMAAFSFGLIGIIKWRRYKRGSGADATPEVPNQ